MSETPDETTEPAEAAKAETAKAGETPSPASDATPVRRRGRPRKADAERKAEAKAEEGDHNRDEDFEVNAQGQEVEQVEVPDGEGGTVMRTKPRTADSDEPGLGWTVQHGVPYPESDALPGQVLPAHQAEGQPVVGGSLYVEDEAHPDGYQKFVQ